MIEVHSLLISLQYGLFCAMLVWCFYIALEPYVRQLWPQSIISWSRLLIGRPRDPLVGRDLVIGVMIGVGIILSQQLNVLLSPSVRLSRSLPLLPRFGQELGDLAGGPFKLQVLVNSLQAAVLLGLVLLLLMLLLRVVLRIPWIAGIAFLLMATVLSVLIFETSIAISWITNAIIAAGIALTLTRVGLLSAIVSLLVTYLFSSVPMTSDLNCWYGGSASFSLLVVAGLLVLGVYLSLPMSARPRTAVAED